ncbi:NAD dependent epimerase/dehydratase family protein [Natronincola ferrireducens]|uniref:NAD dependent epimerase/dehydratase family protein n=1 Tax=Natronincola ferrireducens TaxID=393762 RepID=A0A1G9CRM1_9FIRM|nr:NAD dependent epimerase/dehydratase family protein [Natronincola ferrireducens]
MPVKIVRPFNVYGPGLKLDDKRVVPDFCRDALYSKKITLLSDGIPTRSFCYVRDALSGFMATLLSNHHREAFNIGNDEIEISMIDLAKLIAQNVGDVEIEHKQSNEVDYLIDNPQRRCPDLTKARTLLDYNPKVNLEEGLARTLKWYKEAYGL